MSDPLTPEQLVAPVARALYDDYATDLIANPPAELAGVAYALESWATLSGEDRTRFERQARAAITAAIDAGLVVRAEERDSADRLEGEVKRARVPISHAIDVYGSDPDAVLGCLGEALDFLNRALLSQPEREDPPSEDESDEREEGDAPCPDQDSATTHPTLSNPAPPSEAPVAGREACPECEGGGEIWSVSGHELTMRAYLGQLPPDHPAWKKRTCETCHGTGTVSTDKQGAGDA